MKEQNKIYDVILNDYGVLSLQLNTQKVFILEAWWSENKNKPLDILLDYLIHKDFNCNTNISSKYKIISNSV